MNPSPSKKRAALYVRVSTAEQGEKYGPEYQEKEMIRFVEFYGYKVQPQHIYRDIDFSGTSPINERMALPKLFDAASRKEFDVVLVWKLDRFFRKTLFLLDAIEQLHKLSIGFISTTQTEVNTTTTTGKFMLGLLGIIAEMERDNIMERTAAGRQAAANAGKWVGGRCPPYGYDIDPDTKIMKVNEAEAKLVRKMFDWFVNDHASIYQIQLRFNTAHIPTKSDSAMEELKRKKRFKKDFRWKNPSHFWGETTILSMLKQHAYTGQYFYGKRSHKKDQETGKKKTVLNPREQWVPINCIQIVDKKLWQKAQDRLEENSRLSKRNSRHEYLLTGKVACGCCGSAFVGYTQPKWKKQNGERELMGEYTNYRCRRNSKAAAAVPCQNRQVSGALLDTEVWDQIEQLLSDPEYFIKELEKQEAKQFDVQELQAKNREIGDALIALDKQYGKACELFEKGLLYQKEGEIEEKAAEINAEKEKLIAERDGICGFILTEEQKKERILAAKDAVKYYADTWPRADFQKKKELVQKFIKTITITKDRIRVEFTIDRPEASGGSSPRIEPTSPQRGRLNTNNLRTLCGAVERTRTSTSLRIHAPQACASTNSATTARRSRATCHGRAMKTSIAEHRKRS